MIQPDAAWFVGLPDTERAEPVARLFREQWPGVAEVTHLSGRPWLLGTWRSRQVTVRRGAHGLLTVLGEHEPADVASLTVATVHDLDAVQRKVHGSVCLAASGGGLVRVQGTATGLRRIYRTVVHGVPVVSDRADVLAGVTRAEVDPDRVATRLLFPDAPWPLGWSSVWCGVTAVFPGHYVLLDRRNTCVEARWWTPPSSSRSRPAGIEAFRVALSAAVRVRARPGQTVVSHLSGLDSTSVCSLAVRAGADVVALTAAQPDAMDDDVRWAERTVSALRESGHDLEHEVIPAGEAPLVYDGILSARDAFDEPFLMLHNRSRLQHVLDRGEVHRPSVHLMGAGGDEMCTALTPWLHTLLRTYPGIALRYLRVAAARNRWPVGEVARSLLTGRTYGAWLRAAAAQLERDGAASRYPLLAWDLLPALPEWISANALRAVQRELVAAAELSPVLAGDRGTHHALAGIHAGGQLMRCFQQFAERNGSVLSAPFFDDHVMDAALATRVVDRYDPARYKPLLVDAMRGVVPAAALARRTKSETAATAVLGSRRHRDQIIGLTEDSELARLGLIDLDRFRAVCRGPVDVRTARRRIEPTLACEVWLRNMEEVAGVRASS